MINVENAQQDHHLQLMVNHVSVLKQEEYSMINNGHVNQDVIQMNNGLMANVYVYKDIVGGIKHVEDVQIILIQAQINQHVFQNHQMLIIILKIILFINVEKIK